MKVKDLQSLLCRLDGNDEVVLLDEAAPLSATNDITGTVITQVPCKTYTAERKDDEAAFSSKLVLTYSMRNKEERMDF